MSVEKFALGGPARSGFRGTLHVGLVNNMPDAAMRATELQFARLLKDASGAMDVRLHLFSLRDIPRGDEARARMEGFYADAASLPSAGLDALIVTGAEPRAEDLRDEPYWNGLAHLVDWAETGTIATLFSCLAAHAAVLHLDGIVRRPLAQKRSGVFQVERLQDDPLLAGLPALTYVPHSRRNEIPQGALADRNYRVLSRLRHGGVDLFTRHDAAMGRSLFVFAQGHPEYAAETLGREFLRDVGRFLHGEGAWPAVPDNYFDRATENALEDLGAQARGPEDLAHYNRIIASAAPLQSWRGHTVRLFANWLGVIAAEKARRAPAIVRARKRA